MNDASPLFRNEDASAPPSQPEPPAAPPVNPPAVPAEHEAMRPTHLPPRGGTPLPAINVSSHATLAQVPPPQPTEMPLLRPPVPHSVAPGEEEEDLLVYRWLRERVRETPSWAVSFVSHLALLLILALLVVRGGGNGGPLSLTLTMGPESGEEEGEEEVALEAPAEEEPAPEEEEEPEEEIIEEEPEVVEEAPVEATDAAADDGASAGGASDAEGQGDASGGGGGGGGGDGVGFMGIYGEYESVAYVVDCSGSMEGAKLEAAKYELIRSIESLGNDRFFIISFFDDIEYTYPASQRLMPATRVNVDAARRWIMEIEGGGGTNPDRSLARAFRAEAQVVYFMTDGEVVNSDSTWAVIDRYRPSSTIIHTIGFDSQVAAPFLREIARECGGTYRFQLAADLADANRKPLIDAAPRIDVAEVYPDLLSAVATGNDFQALQAAEALAAVRDDLSTEQLLEAGRTVTARLRETEAGQTHFSLENALMALARDDVADVTNPDSWEAYWDQLELAIQEQAATSILNQAAALRRAGRLSFARQLYEQVVDQFPGTPWAEDAQATLDNASLWRAP